MRPYRRSETPAGAQTQVAWTERQVDLGDNPQKAYAWLLVLLHSCKAVLVWGLRQDQLASSGVVQVLHQCAAVTEHPRRTPQRVVIAPARFEGPGNQRVAPPVPTDRMSRRLQGIVALSVEQRPVDL